jgi:integrase
VVQEYLNDADWRRKVSVDYRKQITNMFSEESGAGYICMKRYLGQDVAKLTRAAVLTLRDELIKECAKRKGTDGRAQAHKVLRALERVLDRAFALMGDAKHRPDNPVRVLTDMDKWSVKAGPGIAPPLEDDELQRVIAVLNNWQRKDGQGPIQRKINLIQLLTGFRFERAQSLRRDMVRKVKEKVGSKMVERAYLYFQPEQGKHRSREFFFPITPELKRVLDSCRYEIEGAYFTPDASWLKPTNSADWWEHLFEDAGLERERGGSHRIRSTVGTHLAALNEGNPFASSYLLDHSPKGVATVTADSYLDMRRWSHGWLQKWHTHLVKELKLSLP